MQTYETELYHYGRLGMKWYQHIFGDADARAKYSEAKQRSREDMALAKDKKALRSLSDQDLKERIERLKLEQQYRELVTGRKEEIKIGDGYVKTVLKSASKKYIEGYAGEIGKQKAQKKIDKKKKAQARASKAKALGQQVGKDIKDTVKDIYGETFDIAKQTPLMIKDEINNGIISYRNYKNKAKNSWSDPLRS